MAGFYSEEWLQFVMEINPVKPYTNSQHEFGEWLLENKDNVNRIGDMERVFMDMRKFLRKMQMPSKSEK